MISLIGIWRNVAVREIFPTNLEKSHSGAGTSRRTKVRNAIR
jgi:hypothetical protein